MQFDIITLFPEMFEGPLTESIIKRAQDKKLISINFYQLRHWGIGRHKQVDDTVYGGGTGMLLRPDVVIPTIEEVKKTRLKRPVSSPVERVILLTPQGKTFKQSTARRLAKLDRLILVCGHYEGFDERIRQFVDEQISIGSYILTGGELPAMVLIDAISRLIPGVLPDKATKDESFSFSPVARIEYPQYTKPAVFRSLKVPDILLSGNHAEIARWRKANVRSKSKK